MYEDDEIDQQICPRSTCFASQADKLLFKLREAIAAHSDSLPQPPRRDRHATPQDTADDDLELQKCRDAARRRDDLARQIFIGLTGREPDRHEL